MEVAYYARNSETREQRKVRIERARAQAVVALTPKPIAHTPEGIRWKGIVDGTEVRVTERWKPSRKVRHGRAVRKVERGKVHVQTNRDIALQAQMGTIHEAR
jgi:hypothetical protein